MATKSGLIASINGYITAVITQTKLRNGFLDVVNSFFQTTTIDEDTTGTNKFTYSLRYKKLGNIVFIDGWIQNKYLISKADLNIATIPNSLFYAKTGQNTDTLQLSTSETHLLTFTTSNIYLTHSIAPNEKIYINAHYQTND